MKSRNITPTLLITALLIFPTSVLAQAPTEESLPPLILPSSPRAPRDLPKQSTPIVQPQEAPKLPPAATSLKELELPSHPGEVSQLIPSRKPRFFQLQYRGKTIGKTTFSLEDAPSLGSQSYEVIRSETILKVGPQSVQAPLTHFWSKVIVNQKSLEPTYFKSLQKMGLQSLQVECVYSPNLIAQTEKIGDNKKHYLHKTLRKGKQPSVWFNNLFGSFDTLAEHYWLLVRQAHKGGTVYGYDPIVRQEGDLYVVQPKKTTYNGKSALLYSIVNMQKVPLAEVIVQQGDMELLAVKEFGNGIQLLEVDRKEYQNLTLQQVDLEASRQQSADTYFGDPSAIKRLEAELEISYRGHIDSEHKITGYESELYGKLKPNYFKGVIHSRSRPIIKELSTPYPQKEVQPPAERYLQPESGIESDQVDITIKARQLAWQTWSTLEVVQNIVSFTGGIQPGAALPSARYSLKNQVANPESRALLSVALCRAIGIPARMTGGLAYVDNHFRPHHWFEVWFGPEEGWVAFDPSSGEMTQINATHLALWERGEAQNFSIKTLSYYPRDAANVPYNKKELEWEVGSQRSYQLTRQGEEVGTESLLNSQVLFQNDQDLYQLQIQKKPLHFASQDATLLVQPDALPQTFTSEEKRFQFRKGFVQERDLKNDTTRRVAAPQGAYLEDSRFYTTMALSLEQSIPKRSPKLLETGTRISYTAFDPHLSKISQRQWKVKEQILLNLDQENSVMTSLLIDQNGWKAYLDEEHRVLRLENNDFRAQLLDIKIDRLPSLPNEKENP